MGLDDAKEGVGLLEFAHDVEVRARVLTMQGEHAGQAEDFGAGGDDNASALRLGVDGGSPGDAANGFGGNLEGRDIREIEQRRAKTHGRHEARAGVAVVVEEGFVGDTTPKSARKYLVLRIEFEVKRHSRGRWPKCLYIEGTFPGCQ